MSKKPGICDQLDDCREVELSLICGVSPPFGGDLLRETLPPSIRKYLLFIEPYGKRQERLEQLITDLSNNVEQGRKKRTVSRSWRRRCLSQSANGCRTS